MISTPLSASLLALPPGWVQSRQIITLTSRKNQTAAPPRRQPADPYGPVSMTPLRIRNTVSPRNIR